MIDPYDMYLSFQSYVNTYSFGWYRINTDFIRACNDISNDLWEIETRRAEKSQEARDNLRPFLKTKPIVAKKQNSYYSIAIVPDDYGRFASGRIIDQGEASNCDTSETDEQRAEDYYDTITEGTIELIDEQRWGACLKHKTKMPTLENPKMNLSNSQFRIAPRTVSNLVLAYYTKPVPAVLSYTITPGNVQTGQGDQLIYNKSGSVPLQWPTTMIGEFISRLGIRFGMFTRDQFFTQAAMQEKASK